MTRLEYYKALAAEWVRQSGVRLGRTEFYRGVAALWTANPQPNGADDPVAIDAFRRLVINDPDALRRRILGFNALRWKRLPVESRRALEVLGGTPDLLGPLGCLRHEPSHTQVLAHILDPARSPDIAPSLLRALLLLASVPAEDLPDDWSRGDVRVEAEAWLPHAGRVDLRVTLPAAVVLIEVKVDSEEGDGQLTKYSQALSATKGTRNGYLVYLTLPSGKRSSSGVAHQHIHFVDVMLRWLPHARHDGQEPGYLARYVKSVALLCGAAGRGSFEEWTFSTQSAALALVEPSKDGP